MAIAHDHPTDDEPVLHDVDYEPLDDLLETDTTAVAPASVFDALKAQKAKAARARTFDLVVPGWGELLALRLGPVTSQQQTRLAERVQRSPSSADAGLLIAAFREVVGRARASDEFAVLPDEDGDPLGLDKRLAERLDLGPVTSAREALEGLYQRTNSPALALMSAANAYLEWARSADADVDEAFLGE